MTQTTETDETRRDEAVARGDCSATDTPARSDRTGRPRARRGGAGGPPRPEAHNPTPLGRLARAAVAPCTSWASHSCSLRHHHAGRTDLHRVSARPAVGQDPGRLCNRRDVHDHVDGRRHPDDGTAAAVHRAMGVLLGADLHHGQLRRTTEPQAAQSGGRQAHQAAAQVLRRASTRTHHQPRDQRFGQGPAKCCRPVCCVCSWPSAT